MRMQLRLSLVGRSAEEVEVAASAKTPALMNPGMDAVYNDTGDQSGVTLPVSDPTSRLHGNHLFRATTSFVDLRNMGVGL